jgi:uncharacterized protein YegP (UPF0339 family)
MKPIKVHTTRFDIYEAKDGWRWRIIATNGKIIAESGEAYSTKSNAKRAAHRLHENVVWADYNLKFK